MSIDSQKIPESLQDLVPLAQTFGVADEKSRCYLIERTPLRDKKNLTKTVLSRSRELNEWFRSFPLGKLTEEAVAFRHLLDAAEEALYST
jgi:hypothetical protein